MKKITAPKEAYQNGIGALLLLGSAYYGLIPALQL